MAKWKIVARPDEEDYYYGLKPQEKYTISILTESNWAWVTALS